MKTTHSGARNQEGCPTSPYPVYRDGGGCRHRDRVVSARLSPCEQQLARGAEGDDHSLCLDLAEMMEQQMSGEDAMEIAFSLGMPRV